MKKIYFDKLDGWKNGILIISTVVLMLLAELDFFTARIPELQKIAYTVAQLFIVLYFGKMFFFKNYVSWNSLGLNIKINQFIGKGFIFKKVNSFGFEKGILEIEKMNGKRYSFDLNAIQERDQQKLLKILEKHSTSRAEEYNGNFAGNE